MSRFSANPVLCGTTLYTLYHNTWERIPTTILGICGRSWMCKKGAKHVTATSRRWDECIDHIELSLGSVLRLATSETSHLPQWKLAAPFMVAIARLRPARVDTTAIELLQRHKPAWIRAGLSQRVERACRTSPGLTEVLDRERYTRVHEVNSVCASTVNQENI